MRDAVKRLGSDPDKINPICPSDLVIDHSIQVDFIRSKDALKKNEEMEYERNKERFMFLKWGAKAFQNMLIVPPGSGIIHQVNLEYLARVVFDMNGLLYPDSVVGTDSHTTMINGLGVLGWGVGGIEAEAVMLGQAMSMLVPKVVGYRLDGVLSQYATSTDLVLTITKHLRQVGVVGKFVEFFGPGVSQLSIADRATISNMCPEYGATVGFFPVDQQSLAYLKQTGRSDEHINVIEKYLTTVRMLRNYDDESQDPVFSEVVSLDLGTIVSSVSGPKRPHDRVSIIDMKADFRKCLTNKMDIFDAAEKYAKDQTPLIILVGKEYGSGSSRDWAAKGPYLLGVRAVIAESYERIHRSNLVGMGIIPLEYLPGQTAESLGLTGHEAYDIAIPENCQPGQNITVTTDDGKKFEVILRFDTEVDLTYYKHGGILNYMIRKML
ncbi:hypothetical protein E2986_10998 [Frieseomelitta varia]|uniref:Aconitase/3-isopropylmalate dehydratase large subunit alpha/beta/alpha domain-containing protein n=1 Tax=Frieseomelitta varia TaxID=561572 RepID=A0A833RX13_9HYME|nr:hypothetical protein E2986_10998 [Frieseomelitta varia]